jgi:hypothetical protein
MGKGVWGQILVGWGIGEKSNHTRALSLAQSNKGCVGAVGGKGRKKKKLTKMKNKKTAVGKIWAKSLACFWARGEIRVTKIRFSRK